MGSFRKSYFTLLEVLISMGVFAILMLALMQFFVTAQGVLERTGNRAEFYDSSRIALELLANDLSTAFYSKDHDVNFLFFEYDKNNTKQVTFVTQRPEGMTEVCYVWDDTNLKIHLLKKNESEIDFSISNPLWCTRGDPNWRTDIRAIGKADSNLLLDNVFDFNIECFDNHHDGTGAYSPQKISIDATTTPDKFPNMILISMTVVSQAAIDQLKARGETDETIKELFNNTVKAKLAINDPSAFSDGSKEMILFKGAQSFTRVLFLDRGQYD